MTGQHSFKIHASNYSEFPSGLALNLAVQKDFNPLAVTTSYDSQNLLLKSKFRATSGPNSKIIPSN